MTQQAGQHAEQMALTYLTSKGLKSVTQNYRCRLGEIDLIMKEGDYLVFVEVRSRSNLHFGGGLASITYAKRQKIIKATSHYLMAHKTMQNCPIRFDVVSIDGKSEAITWIKDAFSAEY